MRISRACRWSSVILAWYLAAGCVGAASSGDHIAYLRLTDHYWQVWTVDPRGRDHRQVTFDPVDKARVSWAPERDRLLYSRNDGKLFVVDPAASKENPVPLTITNVYDAQWAAQGQQIAFTATTSLQADNAELWVANVDGTELRRMTDQVTITLTPAWNPTTGTLLYSAGKPGKNQEIWEFDPKSGRNVQLTVSNKSALDPSINARGDVAYSSDTQGSYDIWLLRPDQQAQRLTTSSAYEAQPSWSPDGAQIVFYRLEGRSRRLWVLDPATGKELAITPDDVFSRYPAWIR